MQILRDLLVDELKDLLHAEGQLVKALPKMARAAHSPELKIGFQKHLEETKGHVERLKQVFETLGEKPKAKACKAMQGLVEEGQETIAEGKETSGYGTLRAIAEKIGEQKVARLLTQTLAEEEKTDKLLTKVSQPLLDQAMREPEAEA
jgi:ferritin-like metal-binding protein YciE